MMAMMTMIFLLVLDKRLVNKVMIVIMIHDDCIGDFDDEDDADDDDDDADDDDGDDGDDDNDARQKPKNI